MKKTVSFAALHMSVAFAVGYLMSGDVAVGGALALVEPACNTVAFYFHEKLWARSGAGIGTAAGSLWDAAPETCRT